ncbi:MAG TPA: ANTAR domain-containing protein [Gaiellaceae bacterium]|nr:ANTAR domain-containing protein [Gaiellaceae bacterium]
MVSDVERRALERLAAAEKLNRQLQQALESRVVIEQAKGVLRERLALSIDEAFALLRYAARSSGINLHQLAARVVREETTPSPVTIALARQSRWRAVLMRERVEAHRERLDELRRAVDAQLERLGNGAGELRWPRSEKRTADLDLRRARAARNESLYRNVNEAIEQSSHRLGRSKGRTLEFICECARRDCVRRVRLPLDEYEWVRSVATRFVVIPEHHEPELENVVREMADHWVVDKVGAGAEVARKLDPRGRDLGAKPSHVG